MQKNHEKGEKCAMELKSKKDIDEMLERVAELHPYRVIGKVDNVYNEAWNDAVWKIGVELEKLPSVQQLIVSDWISVDDKLPYAECGESPTVYCYCQDVVRGGRWAEMLYYNGGVWCKPTGETFDYKVLAWYPLPKKPYREKV